MNSIKSSVHLRSASDIYDAKMKSLKPDDYLAILNNGLESYQITHPHWHFEVLVSLIK